MKLYRKSYWKTTFASLFVSSLTGALSALVLSSSFSDFAPIPSLATFGLSYVAAFLLGVTSLVTLMIGFGGLLCLRADSRESRQGGNCLHEGTDSRSCSPTSPGNRIVTTSVKGEVSGALDLRVGEWVEIRAVDEILATLDENSRLEGLPLMPEMLQFCGRRFKVLKRADKTCDAIHYTGSRRMINAVHLEGLRCNGEFHDGCQASCAFFWKESWLKRVSSAENRGAAPSSRLDAPKSGSNEPVCTLDTVMQATRILPSSGVRESNRFFCQATDLFTATSALPWWDLRQYFRDLVSGNIGFLELLRWALIHLFNIVQKMRKGCEFPYIEGTLTKTPLEKLDLQPGDLVQVKSRSEIEKTLDRRRRNRGLSFDPELFGSCGKKFRVRNRVHRIIDEKTGVIKELTNASITLEGVTCSGFYRGLCPRGDYPFWREIWLKPLSGGNSKTVATNHDFNNRLSREPVEPNTR